MEGRAKPVTKEVLRNAKVFLWSFPLGIESPEIGAEPDGAISLEWYRSSSRVISISINPGGRLYFAAIIGGERRHGDGFALFEVSEDLVKLIENVTSEKHMTDSISHDELLARYIISSKWYRKKRPNCQTRCFHSAGRPSGIIDYPTFKFFRR